MSGWRVSPDVIAARYSQEFLRNRDVTKPFFLTCSFPGPHSPWMVPDEWGIRYDADAIPMWANRYDRFEGKPTNQRKLRLMQEVRGEELPRSAGRPLPDGNVPQTQAERDRELQELLACCYSYLELIDQMVGEVVATLKDAGLYEETAIVFTADHGDMAGSHGMMNKGAYMYDEIYRIPLLVKAPGTPQHEPQRRVRASDGRDRDLSARDGRGGTGEHDGAEPARPVAAAPCRG